MVFDILMNLCQIIYDKPCYSSIIDERYTSSPFFNILLSIFGDEETN